MPGPVRKLIDQLWGVFALVGLIWLVRLLSLVLDLNQWGLMPRTLSGLVGIITMPFLHRDLSDLLGNTVPLTVLLLILRTTRPNSWRILLCLQSGAGVLIWGLGRPDVLHLGAGPLLYAIAAYLITAGVQERRPIPIAAAVLVTVLYGTLFWGLLPTAGTHVFWEGHLFGAVFGVIFATQTLRRLRSRKTTT
jgi:membrane associated rhomboid family serine protease